VGGGGDLNRFFFLLWPCDVCKRWEKMGGGGGTIRDVMYIIHIIPKLFFSSKLL